MGGSVAVSVSHNGGGPLAGIRVLEWAQGIAAPFCARLLGDLGAEVIKIEPPSSGDALRREGPLAKDGNPSDGALFAYVNAGKRSVTLDPGQPSGAVLFAQLASKCDVLVESQAPGLVGRMLEHNASDAGSGTRPLIVSVTAFGQSGPLKSAPSSELTLSHRSGLAYHQARGVTDTEAHPPTAGADREGPLACGLAAAVAALSGLLAARPAGAGRHIDLALFDFYAHLLLHEMAEYEGGEREFTRKHEEYSGSDATSGLIWNLPCSDGWVVVSPREDHQWASWLDLLGHPEWSKDAELCGDRLARKRNKSRLQKLMSEWSRNYSRHDLAAKAQAARVAAFPVETTEAILANGQLAHRSFFDRLTFPSGETTAAPGLPFHHRSSDGRSLGRGRDLPFPQLGQDTLEVLGDCLNMSHAKIERLRRHQVI